MRKRSDLDVRDKMKSREQGLKYGRLTEYEKAMFFQEFSDHAGKEEKKDGYGSNRTGY